MKRTRLVPLALVLVVVTTGCLGGFGDISEEDLCADASYDWDTDANATYTVWTNSSYAAVYDVENSSSMELHSRDGLGNDEPVHIESVKFRAEDGTVYDCEDVEVETTRHETIVEFPEENGQFAYTAESSPKRFVTQQYVDGSHEVILPPNREISNPVFGSVQPSEDETERVDGRLHVRWDEPEGNRLVVQYYLDRDVPLFVGIVVVAGIAAIIGFAYHYRLLQGLQRRREEAGIDLDEE